MAVSGPIFIFNAHHQDLIVIKLELKWYIKFLKIEIEPSWNSTEKIKLYPSITKKKHDSQQKHIEQFIYLQMSILYVSALQMIPI